MRISFVPALFFLLNATAAFAQPFPSPASNALAVPPGNLQCEYSDGTLSYRDHFKIEPNGNTAYFVEVALVWNMEFHKTCWSNDMRAVKEGGQLFFPGNIECVDGGKGETKQYLDLNKMLISGTWKGSYPCRWL